MLCYYDSCTIHKYKNYTQMIETFLRISKDSVRQRCDKIARKMAYRYL